MLSCVPRFLVRQVRRAAPAKAPAAGAGVGGTVGAVRAVRRVSRPLRVCRDAGALSLAAAGPTATPAQAPPPAEPAPGGAGQPGGVATADPRFALLPGELLFGANPPFAPTPGGGPEGEIGPPVRVPEIPPPVPAEVPEPAALLWLPMALALVVLVRRLRRADRVS
ncbi:hypothetical protein DFH01_00010 [Falsiroseomonas bella]|uniref:Uncharacterized protein n=1 Tax=Falsiroseomonas bella TaxID=2184016 RepID=A0A317FJC5_9PROT|nr:hypothetical protein [Falsiroseomonas bella]PWS37748.1 hypothetical protein DFH01_00010 [Falsiroseomonas bella]